MSGSKNDLVARLEDFLLKQEGVKSFDDDDDDWDSEAERSLNPGNQSVLNEIIYVLKSQVDSYHKRIEHLHAEVEHLKLQCKANIDESSDLSEVIKDQNSKNERPTTIQSTCTECKDLSLDIAKIKLELATLWPAVNTQRINPLKNVGTQTGDLQMNQPAPELLSEGQALTRSHTSNFENQLN